jgi:hypothetical protein
MVEKLGSASTHLDTFHPRLPSLLHVSVLRDSGKCTVGRVHYSLRCLKSECLLYHNTDGEVYPNSATWYGQENRP